MVFVGDDPVPGLRPINRAIEKRLPDLARRMVDAIRVPKRRLNREVFEPWVELSLVDATQLKQKEDLDSACIVSANAEALELFGFRVCPKTFAKLREEIEKKHGDGRWREESSFTYSARSPMATRSRRSRQSFSPDAGRCTVPSRLR